MLYATDEQIAPVRSAPLWQDCATPTFSWTPVLVGTTLGAPPFYTQTLTLNWTAETTDWYRVLQLNCANESFALNLNFVAVNPGGEYLSLSDVPYKALYVACCIGWSVILAVWSVNWLRYRMWNVSLQRVLTLVPFSKVVFSIQLLYFWRLSSTTGHAPQTLFWTAFVCVALSRTSVFSCLMLTAKGWSITRRHMDGEWTRLGVLSACLFGAHALYAYVGGFALFALVLMYVWVLRYIFHAIAENARALSANVELLRSHAPPLLLQHMDVQQTPVWQKLQLFKRLQVVMVAFVCADVILHLWATVFTRDTPWIEELAEHILDAVLCVGVGWTFRLRPFHPFFFRITNGPPQHQQAQVPAHQQPQQHGARLGGSTDAAHSLLLAAHAHAAAAAATTPGAIDTAAAGAAATSRGSGAGAGSDAAARQPLIRSDSLAVSIASPNGASGAAGGTAAVVRPSPLQRWQPGMPVPALPAPGTWPVDDAGSGGGADATGGGSAAAMAPIILVQNPFSDGHNDVALARPAYEPPAHVPTPTPSRGVAGGAGTSSARLSSGSFVAALNPAVAAALMAPRPSTATAAGRGGGAAGGGAPAVGDGTIARLPALPASD